MTVSKTARLGLTTWSSDSDPFERADFAANNAQLDLYAAIDSQGDRYQRPSATPAARGSYWWDETAKALYRCNGSAWVLVATSQTVRATVTPDSKSTGYTAGSQIMLAQRNGVVSVSGRIATTAAAPSLLFGTVPAFITRPPANWTGVLAPVVSAGGASGNVVDAWVGTDGAISIAKPTHSTAWASGLTINLTGSWIADGPADVF